MFTTAQRATVMPSGPPSSPRLRLAPARVSRTIFDGGWWPRSRDPVEELPGLVVALSDRFGPIYRLLLNPDVWDSRFRRLAVGDRVVRVGWFRSSDPGILIATTERGDQIDLLMVPPDTADGIAEAEMLAAIDPSNRMRAPAIFAAHSTAATASQPETAVASDASQPETAVASDVDPPEEPVAADVDQPEVTAAVPVGTVTR